MPWDKTQGTLYILNVIVKTMDKAEGRKVFSIYFSNVLLSFIHSMIVGPQQGRDSPPWRRRDVAPRGYLADKLFKEGTPSPTTGGTLCHGRGETGKDTCGKTSSPSPTPLRSKSAVDLGQHKCFPRR